jgi:hypothetical protein
VFRRLQERAAEWREAGLSTRKVLRMKTENMSITGVGAEESREPGEEASAPIGCGILYHQGRKNGVRSPFRASR